MDHQAKIIIDKLIELRMVGADLKQDAKAKEIENELSNLIPEGEFYSIRNARSGFKLSGNNKNFIVTINNLISSYRNTGRKFKPTLL